MSENQNISAEINELPDPASFMAPEGAHKKAKKKKQLEEPGGLSMNSLMDIMTIILVFLLKSYSTNPVQLKATPDLKPPASNSLIDPQESTSLTVTLNNILINDEPVMHVENGVVPEADRSSGGYMIDPLFSKLQEEVDHQKRVAKFNKQAEFKGIVTIIADRHVPFSLLSQVMYTAGQAQYGKFKFAVIKQGG